MSSTPDPPTFLLTAHNQAALDELATAIALAQGSGSFTLLLARCNYRQLQRQMVGVLLEKLADADLLGPVRVIELGDRDENLYARIHDLLQVEADQGQVLGAVMVMALESVGNLDNLLVEINKRREEFRRHCHFPVVLWLNDDGYGRLRTLATDFESIAGGETVAFTLPPEVLGQVLQEAADRYFDQLLTPASNDSFDLLRQHLDLGYLQRSEVDGALGELSAQAISLPAELQASVDFARALGVDPATAMPLLRRCVAHWQGTGNPLRQGLALFYLGKAQYQQQEESPASQDWGAVRSTLEQSQQLFDQVQRPDLTAKLLTLLGRTLQQLGAWEDLVRLADQGIALHRRYGHTGWLAQDYGFIARAALKRQQWVAAQQAAHRGLDVVEQLPRDRQWLRQSGTAPPGCGISRGGN